MIFHGYTDSWFHRYLDFKWQGLSFSDRALELKYRAERKQALLHSHALHRFLTAICVMTLFVDWFAFPQESMMVVWSLRIALLIIPNIIISILFYTPIIQKRLDWLYAGTGLAAVTCGNLMQYIAPHHSIAYDYYVFGHFVTIVAFYGMTFLPMRIAHSVAIVGLIEYIMVRVLHPYTIASSKDFITMNNETFTVALLLYCIFWVTSIFLGITLQTEARRSFYHRVVAEQKNQEIEIQRIELQAQNDEIIRHRKLLEEQAEMIAEVNHELKLKHLLVQEEQEKSEQLLRNILPTGIARRLRDGEKIIVDRVDFASVLFADIVGFTKLASSVTPETVIVILNAIYSAFDEIVEEYQVEKIKTIGDSYMVVGGLLDHSPDHVERMCKVAQEFIATIDHLNEVLGLSLCVRIGIHCGEVVAGVIGTKKVAYDLWGDTVNIASRMESHGAPRKIHISEAVHDVVSKHQVCTPNGIVEMKGIGAMKTWYLAA